MSDNLAKARALLQNDGCTCALVKDDDIRTSAERGVKPLLQWLDDQVDLRGYSAADKVVGKAAAFLYVLLGIKELHAPVISEPAAAVLRQHGIGVSFDTLAPAIRNRAGTGPCPMEQAAKDAAEPGEALPLIRKALEKLSL